MTVFNPKKQIEFTRDLRRAYLGQAPSLGLVTRAFGKSAAEAWCAVQLWDLAEFSGCKQKMTQPQIEELSQIIRTEYGYLKVTELMDFFRRFKAGEYGKFYGSADPMAITCALREYSGQRLRILQTLAEEDKERHKARDPEEISFKRKYEARTRMKRFYSYNFRSADFTMEEFEEIWWLFNLGYERQNHGYNE